MSLKNILRSVRLLSFAIVAASPAVTRAAEPPALVVVISIDQFRGDYLDKFQPFFVAGGFNRLLAGGAVYTDCHHRHSYTKTGPGHAVLLTGVYANRNGIIANDWIDYATREHVSCVGDADQSIVGLPPRTGPRPTNVDDPYFGRSPKNLLVTTVGDALKLERGGRPKVIGIAGKDRAAILMSGKLADAAYFMIGGKMVTSTYYRPRLPAWVEAWNAAGKVAGYFGQTWSRLLPEAAYAIQGPDDAEGEDATTGHLGRTFPKMITGGASSAGAAFLDAFDNTPFANDVLVDFAEQAIAHEQLGAREGVTDLLCLGFSANDHVGHLWGPDSHEMMDMVVRTDRVLAGFFSFLDQRIGAGRYVIVLTADHGVAPTPEHVRALTSHVPAGRIDGGQLLAAGEAALNAAFGAPAQGRWLVRDDASFLVSVEALKAKHLSAAAAQEIVRAALLKQDCVQAAYTREQLLRGDVHDELGRRALLSFNAVRSGDVIYQAKPYFISRGTGANHGTPYNYDTHVPLIFYGAGVPAGKHPERVGTDDLAPTLAHLLGVTPPPLADGRALL